MTKVNSGYDHQYRQMAGDIAGATGTSTGTTSTSLTDSGATWTSNAFKGHMIGVYSTSPSEFVYGVITGNGTTSVTVDRWYTVSNPGGSAASTPGASSYYCILPGGAPAWYMGITTNTSGATSTDVDLPGEYATAGGGLIRKLCTVAHTASASSFTLSATFTANSTDVANLPLTFHKIGISPSINATSGLQLFESVLSSDALIQALNDALTVTDTVSM